MRFVWAVAAFLLAAAMIAVGVAQRTVLLGPTAEVAEVTVSTPAPYTLIDGAVLARFPGQQTISATADPGAPVFAAYGRTSDLEAWLAASSYNHVTLADDGGTRVETVAAASAADTAEQGTDTAAEGTDTAAEGTEDALSPVGSDLWLEEFPQEGELAVTVQVPDEMSVLVAADGHAPAPASFALSWPIDNATPWAGPLIVGGGIALVIGVILYILGIRHARRSKGPRRKGIPVAPTEPIDTLSSGKGVGSSSPRRGRKAIGRGTAFVAGPVLLGMVALTGCSPDVWPQLLPSETPSPSPSVIAPENQQEPVVTEGQAARILARISETVAEADAALSAETAETRLGGTVLEERKANYTVRGQDAGYAALPAIQTEPLSVILPEAKDGWPRTVLMSVGDPQDPALAPSLMMMTQEDPWSDYKLTQLASAAASATFPAVAPATIGALQVPPDSPFLAIEPEDIAGAYADFIDKGDQSVHASLFDEVSARFRAKVEENRAASVNEFNQTGAETGTLSFAASAGTTPPVSLATLDSGAIVAVTVIESDTAKPTDPAAVIKLDGNPAAKALAGTDQSATGFTTNYADQLFFYVPNQAEDEQQIQLLAYSSNVVSAGAVPE